MKTTVLILRNTPNSKSKDLQAKLQAQKEILFKILLLWIILEKKNTGMYYRFLSVEPHSTDLMQQ